MLTLCTNLSMKLRVQPSAEYAQLHSSSLLHFVLLPSILETRMTGFCLILKLHALESASSSCPVDRHTERTRRGVQGLLPTWVAAY